MFSKKKKAPERVLINGYGRIGRLALRTLLNQTEVTVVAINELRVATSSCTPSAIDSH